MKKTPKTLRYKQIKKSKKNRILKGVSILIFSTLIIIFFLGDHGVYQLIKKNREREKTLNLIAKLRIKKESLEKEKYNLENNDDYLIKLAREKYRMVLPGEKMFKVIENETSD